MGFTVNASEAAPELVRLARQTVLASNGTIRAFVLECTELPAYSSALRAAMPGMPVWDAVTLLDFVHAGFAEAG
eukprot:6892229-Prymnesium_polylepis.1